MMKPRHQFRSALITGASRGIGAAFACALPVDTRLLLNGRDTAALDEVANGLRAEGRAVETVVGDLTAEEDRARVVAAARTAGVDLLINNAGSGAFGRFDETDATVHQRTIDLNIATVVALCHALCGPMIAHARANGGRAGLINVGSSAAFAPVPQLAIYAASKAFVLSFTEALCAEHARDPIDILAFCPGAVRTEFGARAGFDGGRVPGAMSPATAADSALRALGRKRVLVLDPVAGIPLSIAAVGRSAFAEVLNRGVETFARRSRNRSAD